jgi:hypothetical protein
MPLPRSSVLRARWPLLAALVAISLLSSDPAPARADSRGWMPPVDGGVVRPYEEPPARFAAGHRGVDFSASSGTPVRAANDGSVTFAGAVAGSFHVVVAHAGGIRTSYSFLLRVDVQAGDDVTRGQVVGAAGGSGEGHGPGVLHFGVRIGDRYVDPMLLFEPTDLTKLVHLVPADERAEAGQASAADEARELREVFRRLDDGCGAFGVVCHIGSAAAGAISDAAAWSWERAKEAAELGLQALRAAGDAAAAFARRVEAVVRGVLRTLEDVANEVAGAAEALARAVASGAAAVFDAVVDAGRYLIEHLTACPQPAPVAHPKGSGNLVMAVGGLDSSRRPKSRGRSAPSGLGLEPSFHFEWKALGYKRDAVAYFSYAPDSPAYARDDTYEDLHAKARLLGAQLKVFAAAHPGRQVDLVGHSQGGVVIDLFLMEVYRGHESEFPPIVNVVTFASPHEGTPLADLETAVDQNAFAGVAADAVSGGLPLGATSIRQLAEGSRTIHDLWADRAIPTGIRFLSIVGSEDPVVPSTSGDVPGGEKLVVPVGDTLVPDDHSAILGDDDAISAAQAQLAGGHPADSCGLLVDVGAHLYTTLIRTSTAAIANAPGTAVPIEPLTDPGGS